MKKNIFALTFLFCLTVFNLNEVNAFQSFTERNCKKDHEPEIVFLSSYGKLEYKYKDPLIMKDYSPRTKNSKHTILGLTIPNPTLEVNVETTVVDNNIDEVVCVVPEKIEIFFGFVKPTIYISRDIKDKKCKKTLVLRHEQTHQQINILALNYFLPQMKKLISQHITQMEAVVVPRSLQKKAVEEMNMFIMARMANLVEQFNNFLEKEQDKLDNENNYAFEGSVCPN